MRQGYRDRSKSGTYICIWSIQGEALSFVRAFTYHSEHCIVLQNTSCTGLCAAHNHRRRTHGPERTWHIQTCHWPSSCAAMMAHDSLEHLKVPKTWVACCGFLGCDAQQGTRLSACCANPIRYKCKQMRHSTGRPPAGATARSASQPAMPCLHFCGRRQTQRLRHTEYSLHTIP